MAKEEPLNLSKGQTVYCGGRPGRVLHKCGAHAVKVWTAFERPEQDFLTAKITTVRGFRSEVWPLKSISLEAPAV